MKVVFKISLAVLLGLFPLLARCEISDNDLRKLFIITGASGDEKYGVVVLFKSHFDKNKTACAYKKSHPETTIFIDQEGGSVVRIADAAPPSPAQARTMRDADFYEAVKKSAKKLKSACIDVNLAPVVEVNADPSRAYGAVPEEAIPKARAFSQAMQSEGIKTVLKHFPGWNEHCTEVKELNSIKLKVRPQSEAHRCSVREDERYLFTEKVKVFSKVPSNAWMVSNTVIPELGPYPSSMNPVIHDFARGDIGYKGLLISDALWEIEASPKAVVMALKVVDWVMVGYAADVEAAIPYIREALKRGLITESELQAKLRRIAAFKEN